MIERALPTAGEAPHALVIIGQPVSHSLSPVFQSAALRAAGLDVAYTRREVAAADLEQVLSICCAGRVGGNVTMPHKEAVFARCTATTAAAWRTGAVNTFWWEGEALVGHNTDVDGVNATIVALCPAGVDGDIVLLGAGGSAAAVLVAIDTLAVPHRGRVFVVARTSERATALLEQTGTRALVVRRVEEVDWSRVGLVVNATPVGMKDHDMPPVPVPALPGNAAVFDLVYRQNNTPLVRAALARGLVAEDGLRMLVEQGAAAFASWFGEAPSRDDMWAALGVPRPDANAARR